MTVDQNISSRINLMRILLICGIVFVHVPYNPETSPYLGINGWFDWWRVFAGESLFRIGVPCLSMISGYLLFRRGWQGFDYGATLLSKAKTVLIPFLLWNFGLFSFVWLIQKAGIGIGYFPDLHQGSWRELLTQAFAAEDLPINIPLYFLRDLVVCILLSPLLAYLVKRWPWPTLGILFAVAVVPDLTLVIVLKKSILFSFTFGIFLALHGINLKVGDRFARAGSGLTLAAAAALSVALYRTGPDFPWSIDLALNVLAIIGAVGFWMISAILIRSPIGGRLAATGSLSFWIFCAHYPLLVAMWMVWNRVAGDQPYPIFYVGAITLTFAILAISNTVIRRTMMPVYQVLTGSRGRKQKPADTRTSKSTESAGSLEPHLSQQRR